MALSQPTAIFGIHSITAYNVNTHQPLGTAKVVGSAEISSEGNLVKLNGGSNKYAWQIERGRIESQITLTLREFPSFLFETLLGKALTDNAAESSGSVTAITNRNGTSAVASTGIASVSVVDKGDVKFGKYLVKVVSATTVDVYAYTDVDFAQGTDGEYQNDLLKITASPLTVTQSGNVTIPNFGVQITGDSGTIAMTPGDTATFTARPINNDSKNVTIGASTEVFADFGLLIAAQRQGSNKMQYVDIYRCSGVGLPIAMTEEEFSEAGVTIDISYDSTRDGVFDIEFVEATS